MSGPIVVEKKAAKPPRLYRLARALRRCGLITLVIIVVYVAAALLSVLIHPPSIGSSGSGASGSHNQSGVQCNAGTTLAKIGTYSCSLNVTNNGSFPLSTNIEARFVADPGPLLAYGSSPTVTLSSGASAEIIFTLDVVAIPQNDSKYVEWGWLNFTYAYLFTFGIAIMNTSTFHAPTSASVQPSPSKAGSVDLLPQALLARAQARTPALFLGPPASHPFPQTLRLDPLLRVAPGSP